ncbi:MAG: DUF1848 domain-containing protein [Methanomassiliicoccales archaeon]
MARGYRWSREKLSDEYGRQVEAIAPLIISASRAMDIPSCHSDWFMERLRRGYVEWRNPFNGKTDYISFSKVRAIVFWTKDASPLLQHLQELDEMGISYYFQYTVNDYEGLGYEPRMPPLKQRARTFKELSERIGKERVLWRFDPLLLSEELDADSLLQRVAKVGEMLHHHTDTLTISFIDIQRYRRLRRKLEKRGIREPSEDEIIELAQGISALNERWELRLQACAEEVDLKRFGIEKAACVEGERLKRIAPHDTVLHQFIASWGCKDPGQRKECGCLLSKDIGGYGTCGNGCVYCYANHAAQASM